jgi:hypothetical protein
MIREHNIRKIISNNGVINLEIARTIAMDRRVLIAIIVGSIGLIAIVVYIVSSSGSAAPREKALASKPKVTEETVTIRVADNECEETPCETEADPTTPESPVLGEARLDPHLTIPKPTERSSGSSAEVSPSVTNSAKTEIPVKHRVRFEEPEPRRARLRLFGSDNSGSNVLQISKSRFSKYLEKYKSPEKVWEYLGKKNTPVVIEQDDLPGLSFLKTVPPFVSEMIVKPAQNFENLAGFLFPQSETGQVHFPFLHLNEVTHVPFSGENLSNDFFSIRAVKKISFSEIQGNQLNQFDHFPALDSLLKLEEISITLLDPVKTQATFSETVLSKFSNLKKFDRCY